MMFSANVIQEIILAAATGVLSSISLCVLPLLAGLIIFTGLVSSTGVKGDSLWRRIIPSQHVYMTIGYMVFFIFLSLPATFPGSLLNFSLPYVRLIIGLVIAVLGTWTAWSSLKGNPDQPDFLASLIFGIGLAVGWDPCSGSVLNSIMILSSNPDFEPLAIILLTSFTVGFGLMVFLACLTLNQILEIFQTDEKPSTKLSGGWALALAIYGCMIMLNQLNAVTPRISGLIPG